MTTYRIQCRQHPQITADFTTQNWKASHQEAWNAADAHNLVHHSGALVARAELKICLCGCGSEVSGNYRPGHDARHVSEVYKRFVKGCDNDPQWYEHGTLYRYAINALPTEALKEKFRRRVSQAGWKYHNAAANSLTEQWFSNRLVGLVKQNDATYDKDSEHYAAGILAALGWNSRHVNMKFS